MIRRALKRLCGPWVGSLIALGLRLTDRRAGVVIAYHAIDRRQGDPERELVPSLEVSRFARQLRHLRRFYEPVRIEEFVMAVATRRRGGRFPVCVTFDDDLPHHITHAMPALKAARVPAAFFLSAGNGGGGSGRVSTWWERLQRAIDRGHSAPAVAALLPPDAIDGPPQRELGIHDLAVAIEGLHPEARDEVAERLLQLAGDDPPEVGLPDSAITALAEAGFAIGFHTRRHDLLTHLSDVALEASMDDGRVQLARLSGAPLDAIAYPHGRADHRVASAARRAGFRVGFTTEPVAVTPACDPLLLGRFDPMTVEPALTRSHGAFALGVARTLMKEPVQVSDEAEEDRATVTEIAPARSRIPSLGMRELWRYRELVLFLAVRDVKLRYRQTFFGVSWAVLQPLATAIVFTLLLGSAANVPSEGFPYLVFVFAGMLAWQTFATGLEGAATALVDHRDLVTRVYFPRLAAPIGALLPALVDLGASALVLVALLLASGVGPGPALLTAPLWLLLTILLAFGAGALLCALNVQFRDVRHTLVFVVQLWFFASPVVFPSSLVSGTDRLLLAINPMCGLIDGWRWALIDAPAPPAADLVSLLTGSLLLVAGVLYFRATERRFADVI